MARGETSAFQRDLLFAFGGGDPRITIAVLDGAVDRTHECFRGARLTPLDNGSSFHCPDGDTTASGSHAASVIFGQPCSSVEGVAPLCRGLIVPIFAEDGRGCSLRKLARAIFLAVEQGAHVIDVSGGQFARSERPDPVLAEAIEMCVRRNVAIVAAGGNEGCDELLDLAEIAPVLAVFTLEYYRRRLRSVDPIGMKALVIPGSNIVGAAPEGDVTRRSCANGAAALVAGLVGLLLSRQLRRGAAPDPLAVRDFLLKFAGRHGPSGPRQSCRLLAEREQVQAVVDRMGLGIGDGSIPFPFNLSALSG
ncbi:S8 family serine peptidase [Rhodopseudomonas palustris]|uniref:Peptidase S8/S53 domain-containing protein n=1 Tax=Rhodopseudomonas palustris (strain BisB18) TaxID=316056 RepID=Q21BF5_RHOPB